MILLPGKYGVRNTCQVKLKNIGGLFFMYSGGFNAFGFFDFLGVSFGINQNKKPMGHIAHLRKQLKSLYHNVDLEKKKTHY